MSDANLIVEPSAVAGERPEAVLEELSAVLRKHGYILQCKGEPFVLAKIFDAAGMKALAVAEVRSIQPSIYEWRRAKMEQQGFTRKVR